jgi:hypothetical protein
LRDLRQQTRLVDGGLVVRESRLAGVFLEIGPTCLPLRFGPTQTDAPGSERSTLIVGLPDGSSSSDGDKMDSNGSELD